MISDLGWDEARDEEWRADPVSLTGAAPGRVVRVERTTIRVALDDRVVTVHANGLAVGDWVATDGATWASPLPRRTQLARQASGRTSDEQVLAANVDAVLIVEPLHPAPNARRIERMLTLAWASGATPIVVLTKSDLAERDSAPEIESTASGADVVVVSSATGANLDRLRGLIHPGQTFVLMGPSGAGKSSLVNALAGREVLETGEVRGDGKGRHTTTHRELIVIDGLGCLIDTPGIREVGMTAHQSGLGATFADVLDVAAECRFHDCTHTVEPGCAVRGAVENGLLDGARVASFQRIEREIAQQALRKSTHDRRDERIETKSRRAGMRAVMDAKKRPRGQ
ncbi:ribosome small subunit-dependent GTPase A [Cellulomonas chengniuliangii]|uniref:Small ribosomal subunit biogenesis GTPase RsgA n=1 Tax=Cellulomonas chengniuliangii TaxID=2968084 RepID=A0ABY5KXR9_9CELL|nr:ribosome small subunit-dependent GTPase A [Cellulomonas chengniuliangii]MCC2307951.1 ribosome small subunit-dependent GTPase A [Cellulomonas chengniuliangii]UUI75301.1 ribosome small subunit-dependent GTPase A [Cellulomonas chengniuliangii]